MKFPKLSLLTLVYSLILIASAFYNYDLFEGTKLYGNASSRILLALGPMLGIGSPYRDLYEIVPPGYLMFIASWVRLFGLSMISFKLIQVMMVLLNGYFLIKVCQKLFKHQLLQFGVFFYIIITVHSRIIQTDFFAIDFVATTLVLAGLAALFHLEKPLLKISLAATLFTLASQMKDIYILSLASLAPFYLKELMKKDWPKFVKFVVISAIGPTLIAASVLLYLVANEALMAYLHILKDKYGFAQAFSPLKIILAYIHMAALFEKTFLRFPWLLAGVALTNLVLFTHVARRLLPKKKKLTTSFVVKNTVRFVAQQLNEYGESDLGRILVTVITIGCTLYGIAIYGLYSGSQLTMVVTSFYLLIGLLLIMPLEHLRQLKSPLLRFGLTLALLALFFPAQSVFEYQYFPVRRNYTFEVEKVIKERVAKDECIMHVHGWEVAPSYIYTERKPCSRYFLTNELFNIHRPDIFEKYRTELFNNPAAAIIYSIKGADTDIPKFDDQAINLTKILQNCYTADPRFTEYKDHFFAAMTLYWPNSDLSKEELRNCWQTNSD